MRYGLLYDKPSFFERLWPGTFAYYLDDLAAYLGERKSLGRRFLGAHYTCWLWRVSFYLADWLVLSRRNYEAFVQTRFQAEFNTGASAQSQFLPRDAVPGYTASRSGRRWLPWGLVLIALALLATYANFLRASATYTFLEAFRPAAFLSYLNSTLDRLATLRAKPGLVLAALRAGANQFGRGILSGVSIFSWNWAGNGLTGVTGKIGLLFGSLLAFAASSWVAGYLCIWIASVRPVKAEKEEDREDQLALAISLVIGLIGVVYLVFLSRRLVSF
jgi:hypothetical protein